MKGFALLTAAVLAVIGIGVGLVSGLPSTTYSLGTARFSIVFPASLHRQLIAGFPCVVADAATADEGRISLNIWVLEQSGRCAANPPQWQGSTGSGDSSFGFETRTSVSSSSGFVMFVPGLQLCPPPASDGSSTGIRLPSVTSCWATLGVQRPDYYIAVTVQSREGPAVAYSVLNSFRILGSSASS